jgi:hypothetical protein
LGERGMKLFYRKKGKYADGRDMISIEDRENGISKSLPKPEILLPILLNKKSVYLGDTKYTENDTLEVPRNIEGENNESAMPR